MAHGIESLLAAPLGKNELRTRSSSCHVGARRVRRLGVVLSLRVAIGSLTMWS